MCDAGGGNAWRPNAAGRALHEKQDFKSAWAVGLHEAKNEHCYTYWVVQFGRDVSPAVPIRIDLLMCEWSVEVVQ
jgi:hypothetical protein